MNSVDFDNGLVLTQQLKTRHLLSHICISHLKSGSHQGHAPEGSRHCPSVQVLVPGGPLYDLLSHDCGCTTPVHVSVVESSSTLCLLQVSTRDGGLPQHTRRGRRTNWEEGFSPSTEWLLGISFRSSLEVGTFISWVISLALFVTKLRAQPTSF